MPARDEPAECLPWTRRTRVSPVFPLPGNVRVQSGQQEAYAKVICQDLSDDCIPSWAPFWHAFR